MSGGELPGSAPREDDDEGGAVYGPAAFGPPSRRDDAAAPAKPTSTSDDASELKAVLAAAFGISPSEGLIDKSTREPPPGHAPVALW